MPPSLTGTHDQIKHYKYQRFPTRGLAALLDGAAKVILSDFLKSVTRKAWPLAQNRDEQLPQKKAITSTQFADVGMAHSLLGYWAHSGIVTVLESCLRARQRQC